MKTTDKNPDSSTERGQRFMRLYVSIQSRLFGFVLSLVPRHSDADDIVQEVASIMWTKFDEFETNTDFAAWAFCIARYQVLTYRKRNNTKLRRFSSKSMELIQEMADSSDKVEDRRKNALGECVNNLNSRDMEILKYRYENGLTLRKVAEHFNQNTKTLYSALHRIHIALLHCVQRKMIQEDAK